MEKINEIKKEYIGEERMSSAWLCMGYFLSLLYLSIGIFTTKFFWIISVCILGATLFHHKWHFRRFKK